ncbi:SGNH/GDSL hydrolase family protein [Hydrogenophaga sp.]|uniref:SGNH/GDSL hydrolase family protein n=1 Tax=Hydrogenophaga sp. TaxID=1904254 RepID=UPI003F6EB097
MPIRSLRSALHLPLVVAGLLATGFLAPTRAQDARPPELALAAVDARWHASLEAFAAADLRQAPQPGGVLFVGSSSIRLWNDLETSFSDQPVVIKRGFGGSQLLDCVKLVNRLVLPYKPRMVVVYAGENDIAEGATPQQVLERFTAFVQAVKADLPGSRIAYVSIKPSPLRAGLMPQVREANELIQTYSQTEPQLDFIDVYSLMLDASGQPRAELFSSDRLHMNAEGYALWRSVIASRLKV